MHNGVFSKKSSTTQRCVARRDTDNIMKMSQLHASFVISLVVYFLRCILFTPVSDSEYISMSTVSDTHTYLSLTLDIQVILMTTPKLLSMHNSLTTTGT